MGTTQQTKRTQGILLSAALLALAGCDPAAGGIGTNQRAVTGDCTSSGTAAISPDKEDYFPPETVTLTATGLVCGATYAVRLTTPTQYWPVYVPGGDIITLPAQTASNTGTAVFTYDLTQEYNGNFEVELVDADGNVVATTDFHDSHFRYASISWVQNAAHTATFTVTAAYRRSYPWTTVSFPITGQQFFDPVSTFQFGDASPAVNVVYTATSYDAVNDWVYGTTTLTHTYASNGPFTAGFNGCCRLSTLANNHDGNFQVQTTVRFDISEASPTTGLPPIINAPTNAAAFHFTVPGADNDSDAITCRLATCAEAYQDATPGCLAAPSGLTVDSNTCVVTFNTVGRAINTLWTAQVMLEDHRNGGILTKAPVDFILQIVGADANPPVCSLLNLSPSPASSTSNTAT